MRFQCKSQRPPRQPHRHCIAGRWDAGTAPAAADGFCTVHKCSGGQPRATSVLPQPCRTCTVHAGAWLALTANCCSCELRCSQCPSRVRASQVQPATQDTSAEGEGTQRVTEQAMVAPNNNNPDQFRQPGKTDLTGDVFLTVDQHAGKVTALVSPRQQPVQAMRQVQGRTVHVASQSNRRIVRA